MKKTTSWNGVAHWYDSLMQEEGSYQKELVLPNLLRLVNPTQHDTILDLGCGQGFFTIEFVKKGAKVYGVDISRELIDLAKKNGQNILKEKERERVEWRTESSDNLSLKDACVNTITIILALQNMDNIHKVIGECFRVLKPNGKLFLVLNHPMFRVPKASAWAYDEQNNIQYRRIEAYMSERKEKIQMHPGNKPSEYTFTFHRPLQLYFKTLSKVGFSIIRLEEWTSHKKSLPGKRAKAEDHARKEIPLFLFLEAVKQKEKISLI